MNTTTINHQPSIINHQPPTITHNQSSNNVISNQQLTINSLSPIFNKLASSKPMLTNYPKDWSSISLLVKQAAGWHCQHCGHPHDYKSGHVLTVHHLNGDKSDCSLTNIIALCQRCHLRIQARPDRYALNQLSLFSFKVPNWILRLTKLLHQLS